MCSRVGWYEGRRARCGWSRGAVRASILLDRVFVERQVAVFLHTHIHVGPLGPQMGLRVSRETFARTLSVIFLHSCAKVAWRYGCRFGGVGRPCLALCVWGGGVHDSGAGSRWRRFALAPLTLTTRSHTTLSAMTLEL